MKIGNIKYFVAALFMTAGLASCEDFLDRPAEDTYNVGNFYQTADQCRQGVNYLYNSPWYDFQRGFLKVGEILSGNMFEGSSPYLTFTVNGTDQDLVNMSYSLWATIGHSNVVYDNLSKSPADPVVVNYCKGECLTWKALAYFFLVRTFGDVPIIHDTNAELASGTYNSKYKANRADVYEYIIMTLEEAIELLPEKDGTGKGRLDKYSAKGLLAKVYLTRAGLSGSLSADDLAKAADLAKDVIDHSGRHLMENYADIFRGHNNVSDEALISWAWTAGRDPWTQQNTQQSDNAMVGFDENGSIWGGYRGPSVDLQDAFGVSALEDPANRIDRDARRKATMMMVGDVYDYFWRDREYDPVNHLYGFNYLKFIYDSDNYGKGGPGTFQSGSGANMVKHLIGDQADHQAELGVPSDVMAYGNYTHVLRLADVYLIYAEAKMGTAQQTSDASAIDAYMAVRSRGIPTSSRPATLTWEDVWKERRLELACEGDRWYDFVRLSYYNPTKAINEIKSQRRNEYWSLNGLYKNYYESGNWTVNPDAENPDDRNEPQYNTTTAAPNVTESSFTLPFPSEDVVFNPHLMEDPVHVDVRSEFSY